MPFLGRFVCSGALMQNEITEGVNYFRIYDERLNYDKKARQNILGHVVFK